MKYKGRVVLTTIVILAVFMGLGVRLIFLHLKPSEETLGRIEQSRQLREQTCGPRGRILDREGQILALDISAKHLCVDPKFILEHGDIQAVCKALSQHLSVPYNAIWKRLNQPQRQYVRIQKYMRESTIAPLQNLHLKGLIFEDVFIREYPKGVLGAHVIGFANREGVGSAGIEQRMNSYLQGSPGLRIGQKDGRCHEIYSRRTVDIEPQPGPEVYLTLDQHIQHFAEKALDELNAIYHPDGAWAIVQNVRTGEILAMASLPTFNLNRFSHTPPEWMRNRTINYTYEPGSTMKAIVIAAALDAGVVQPNDLFDCENGRWYYGGRFLHDSHEEGELSVADILKKSSNIGTAKIALKMGNEIVYQRLRAFGFGKQTGIDLPGEDAGIIWPTKQWSKISVTRLAMGHEILVTSLQILSAFSAIANDGIRMRPQIIREIVGINDEPILTVFPEELDRPIRQETAVQMRRLLARTTQTGGTGIRAALRGYLVAGKTGTAQKVNLEKGGYDNDHYIASFVGFLPAENPEISIIVVADDPHGGHYGGTVCAPYFKKIADQTVRYLRIPPEGLPTEPVRKFELPVNREENGTE